MQRAGTAFVGNAMLKHDSLDMRGLYGLRIGEIYFANWITIGYRIIIIKKN